MREAANKAPLVVLNHVVEVVLEELEFEVGQVKAAVIVGRELVRHVQDDLVRVATRDESVSHGSPYSKHLLVRGD